MARKLMWVLPLFLLGLLASTSGADDSSYTPREGFWWKDSVPYTREVKRVWHNAYYQCGYYTPGYYQEYYEYRRAAVYKEPAYVPPKPPAYGPDWKSQALKYAEYRDDLQVYLKTLNALGIQGQQYEFQHGTYGNHGQMNYATGQTLYGYSYNTIRQTYGDTDLNVLYQQAARLTQGAQSLAGDANVGFQSLTAQAGENAARVAEVLAKAQALKAVAESIRPEPRTTERTTGQFFKSEPSNPRPMGKVEDNGNGNGSEFMKMATAQCGSCHSGGTVKGGFKIEDYPRLTAEQKAIVHQAILSPSEARRMPRTADGKAGSLTPDQVRSFLNN